MKDRITIYDHILSIVWLYIMLFPTGAVFNVSIPILFILLFETKRRTGIITPLFVLLLITLLANSWQPYMWFKGISRLVTMGVIFITFAALKGSRIVFPYILIALGYIISSQISYMYDISFFTSLFDRFYAMSDKISDIYQIDLNDISMAAVTEGKRFGGIYINPNNCASFVSVIYALGLCELNYVGANLRKCYLFMGLVAISLLLTGSRTSFIVFSLITVFFLRNRGVGIVKFIIIAIAILTILTYVDIGGFRAFKVGEGMDNSFGVKMKYLRLYLSSCNNPILLLFGCGDITATVALFGSNLEGTDFDLGNILIVFGILFYVFYIIFYIKVFSVLSPQYRIMLIVLLWSLSNSILISYRMCPVWFISLGILYKRSLILKEGKALKVSKG